MVLYYGLLALETANNTAAASKQTNHPRKQKLRSNSIGKMSSSSNSWIYTEDLRKRFEERYIDYRCIFVPVYVDGKPSRHNYSTTTLVPQKSDGDNSWMYSRSLRDHLYYSTSKISLPLIPNISSSACYVSSQVFIRDELPRKKNFKTRFFKRSSPSKEKSTTSLSSTFAPFSNSLASSTAIAKHRTNDVVEEEDDESDQNENHSVPLIKQNSMVSSRSPAAPSNDNNTIAIPTLNNQLPNVKNAVVHSNKLTRLRSFFFKSYSPSSSRSGTQQQQTTLSSTSLCNRIWRT